MLGYFATETGGDSLVYKLNLTAEDKSDEAAIGNEPTLVESFVFFGLSFMKNSLNNFPNK